MAAVSLQLTVSSGCYSGAFGTADASEETTTAAYDTGEPGPAPEEDSGESGADDGGPQASDPQPLPLRRLSHTEYNNTVRDLFPHLDLPTFVLTPDQKPHAFDNDGAALVPSSLLIEQYADAADVIAELASDDLAALVSCDFTVDEGCSREFVEAFGLRAFRRPLTEAELERFHRFFEQAPGDTDFAAGVELTIAWMLQAPQFLYRVELPAGDFASGEVVQLDDYALASRLSYFLWGTMPDAELLDLAAAEQLHEPEQLEMEAWRMLDHPRAKASFWNFYRQWLHADRLERVQKADIFPEFDETLRASMMEGTRRFIEDVLYERDGTLADLLTSNSAFVDAPLAELYGLAPVSAWTEVELPFEERAGVLTQPTFLAGHGHPRNPSPVLRGVWILKEMMCAKLGSPPPVAEAMDPIELEEGMTNRQVYEEITGASECMACHTSINGLGFALENYDTIGRFRTTDNSLPVDPSGSFGEMAYRSPREFAQALVSNPLVTSCATQQWMRFAFGGDAVLRDKGFVADIERAFAEDDYDLKQLLVHIVTHPRFSSYVVP